MGPTCQEEVGAEIQRLLLELEEKVSSSKYKERSYMSNRGSSLEGIAGECSYRIKCHRDKLRRAKI